MSIRNCLVGLSLLTAIAAAPAAPPAPNYSITLLPEEVDRVAGIDNRGQVAVTFPFVRAGLWDGTTIIPLRDLGGGISVSFGISNNGIVAGYSEVTAFVPHGFVYSGGTMIDVGTLGGDRSIAYGANASGEAAGGAETATGQSHAFLYSKGTIHDLGTLGGANSVAFGINNAGVVVGVSNVNGQAGAITHAFVYAKGEMVDLGTLEGGTTSSAEAINNAGVIAGVSNGAGFEDSQHAFIYRNGVMTDIGTLGDHITVNDINSRGQVVGMSGGVGYLYTKGQMLDLNTLIDPALGWTVTAAYGINDAGQIVVALFREPYVNRFAVLDPAGKTQP